MSGKRRSVAAVVRTAVFATVATTAVVVGTMPAQAAGGHYVALGDSYSAGTGAGNYGSSGSCYRSANAYPRLWANANAPASFRFPACAGATTDDVLNEQVAALSTGTTLVSITIGGNDVGFAGVMSTCASGTDQACLDRIARSREEARTVLPGRLDTTYRTIRNRSPQARVVVLGYPRIFAPGPVACGMNLTRRTALNQAADELNSIIADRVAAAGFVFEPVSDDFSGHGVCSSAPWLHGFKWSPLIESYHPNATGQRSGYYPAFDARD